MTEQTISPPVRPAFSEIDFNYGQIRRDMLSRKVRKSTFLPEPDCVIFFPVGTDCRAGGALVQ